MNSRSQRRIASVVASCIGLIALLYAAHLFRQWRTPKLTVGSAELYRDNILLTRTNLLRLAFALEDAKAVPNGISMEILINKAEAKQVRASGWRRSERGNFVLYQCDDYQNDFAGELRFKHRFPMFIVHLDQVEVLGLWVNAKQNGNLLFASRIHFMIDDERAEGHFTGPAVESILRPQVVSYNDRVLYSRPRRARFSWEGKDSQ